MGEFDAFAHNHPGGPRDCCPFGIPLAGPDLVSKISDRQLRHRKNVQAGLSTATATIGIAALGSKSGAALLRRRGSLRAAQKLESHTTGLLTGGAGLGGVAGFNSASISRAEAKRPTYKPQHIHKRGVHPLVRQYGLTSELPTGLDSNTRHEVWQQRDKHLNQKRNRWDRTSKTANATRIGAEATAGAVSSGLGAMALRDAYQREHPGKLEAKVKGNARLTRAVAAKPTFRKLAVLGAAGLTAAAAKPVKRVADKKTEKYSTVAGGTAARAAKQTKHSFGKSAFGIDHS